MVFLRSTTDWTWPRLFKSVARSIVAFMRHRPINPRGPARYSEPSGAFQWLIDAIAGLLACLRGWRRGSLRGHEDTVEVMDDAIAERVVRLGHRRLAALGVGEHDLAAVL